MIETGLSRSCLQVSQNILNMMHEVEFECIERILEDLPEKDYKQVWRILYGDGIE